jgi:hypothetical protein
LQPLRLKANLHRTILEIDDLGAAELHVNTAISTQSLSKGWKLNDFAP